MKSGCKIFAPTFQSTEGCCLLFAKTSGALVTIFRRATRSIATLRRISRQYSGLRLQIIFGVFFSFSFHSPSILSDLKVYGHYCRALILVWTTRLGIRLSRFATNWKTDGFFVVHQTFCLLGRNEDQGLTVGPKQLGNTIAFLRRIT